MNTRFVIGRNVRLLRRLRGLSQEELAKKARFQKSYIGGVERGERNITIENIDRLADALGTRPYLLLMHDLNDLLFTIRLPKSKDT